MAKISISMSDQMEQYVSERVANGEYNNTSEYFRDLVRRDQEKREAREKLGRMIDRAEAGPISDLSPKEVWDRAEERFRQKRDGK
jgi:antitoxin ParD1/3/4